MSWECRYKVQTYCRKLDTDCDPGRKGCVLYGKVYFPFSPEKNPPSMRPSAPDNDRKTADGNADDAPPEELTTQDDN